MIAGEIKLLFIYWLYSLLMIVRDEFLKQCETEAFLKFNSYFSTEFARWKDTCVSEKLL